MSFICMNSLYSFKKAKLNEQVNFFFFFSLFTRGNLRFKMGFLRKTIK
jgi:hypothetical protein